MDQSTLVERVAARLNIDSDDPLYSSLTGFVDEALHYLESSLPDGPPWLRGTLDTTITTQVYNFTQLAPNSTISRVLSVKILDSTYGYQPLTLRSSDEIDQIYADTSGGLPESWYVEGDNLYIYPSPSASYSARIRVLTTEQELGGGSSTPVMPVVFHTAIIDAALLFAYQALLDDKRVAQQERQVARWVQRMKAYGAQYDPAPQIRVREWMG